MAKFTLKPIYYWLFFNIMHEKVKMEFHKLIKRQSCHHIETSQFICSANQLTGFSIIANLVFNELNY